LTALITVRKHPWYSALVAHRMREYGDKAETSGRHTLVLRRLYTQILMLGTAKTML
jgi:hypothetical protein